ncbi:MAG: hypothetical protein AB7U23_14485 [Dehalococcoidia bacterium]
MNLVARSAAALHRVLFSAAFLLLLTGPLEAGVIVYAAGWSVWHWLWVWPAAVAVANVCAVASRASGGAALRITPPQAPWREALERSVARTGSLGPRIVSRPGRSPPS